MIKVHVRWAIQRDLLEILAIEKESSPCPWGKEDFLHLLRQRNCIGMVAEHGDKVVGFMAYELRERSIKLLNLAVAPEYRRVARQRGEEVLVKEDGKLVMLRGVGTALVSRLQAKLRGDLPRRARLTVDVRESALPAQLLLRRLAFQAVSVLRGHFYTPDACEDAYRMEYTVDRSVGGENCPDPEAVHNRLAQYFQHQE